ncbi:hypothetical protein LTR99_000782 [Exophiala xenobiotica]|uniref:Choline monooxygenase, chloroplastic n=1 Tax=Vermiconidia calcicola TaxID=1690605 RepID=A0AAV9QMJ5_9PEZI|nr:hypothetical protein LTR92_002798 [Exophiala xenobiotica]KAK5545345.1 hypothetical protein LTR25_000352 [Vermiconidia calcicola]KAK5548058.1 hypothetical protein LTR23_001767 [Chaetothyriales sp. CCFEE 6169]KAK5230907.1 hypothetical protein LTR72_000087 [Exophiala xenobiotica]KAK5238152.1 hypothetical protein LTR47_001245 [Exophiala xenobiotica]
MIMSNPTPEEPSAPDNTALPSSWYRSPALYELERRAVFSKEWMFVTHKNRFTKPGDYVRFNVANLPFFLIMDRSKTIRGFHNVCRHRAYPVIRPEAEDTGTKSILACYYHGWSYGLDGRLAKAPRFDEVPTFDKTKNGLFPIHVHIDQRGFVWVNLESSETPSVSWESRFAGSDTRDRLAEFNMDEYVFDHAWSMEGKYNWKACVDNYNECYHCQTTHPLFVENCDLSIYRVEPHGGEVVHFIKDKPGKSTNSYAPSFFFPNASVSMTAPYWYLMRVVPTGPTTTTMEYEVYRNSRLCPTSDHKAFTDCDAFFKQVEAEDKALNDAAQTNLNTGTYSTGKLHPSQERGVLHFQKLLREAVMQHRQLENDAKHEIWPARLSANPGKDGEMGGENNDVKFCADLEACSVGTAAADW